LTGFGGSNDTLDVEAGFLLDAAGNASASTRTDVTIAMKEILAPKITDITATLADTNGNTYADDTEIVTFTATLDKPIKSGTTFDVTLESGDTITFTSTDSTSATITSDVRMTSTFSDFAKGGLAIDSYTIDSASDVYGNLVADDTTLDSFDNLAAATFGRDTEDPTSSVNQQTGSLPLYTINEDGSSTLRLTINDADEMGFADGDVKVDATYALDFTKLFWSINGVDSNSFQFETSTIKDYVASAEMSVTDTTGTLDITLSTKGRTALEGLTGFGGSNDTLDVEAGFLLDAAGNASASTRTDVTIAMKEILAPKITDITATLADTNGNTYADDTEIVTFTATLDKPIKSGTTFDVTLESGDTITFTSTDSTSATITSDVRMTSTFSDFAKGGLAIDSYTIDSASDVYGNLVADDTTLDSFDNLAAATFGRDTEDPTSSVNQQTGSLPLYTINEDGSSTLRLTINDADEMGFADGDVKVDATYALDFTKLFWSINGVDSNSFQFETSTIKDYVASAEMSVTDTTGTLDITLSTKGRTALEGLTGFGGSNDTLDVEAGFLLDAAGNASASTRTDVTIAMKEILAPKITDITATLADTNGNTYADDTEIVTFTATLDKPIKSGTTFDVTLESGDTITFTSTDSTSATITSDVRMTSTFSDFAKGGLAIDSYTIDSASDVYGNLVADDTTLDSFDNLAAATFGRDTEDPTSSVNQQTGSLPLYTINEDGSSTLRLTINDADEMGFSDGDVKVDATGALDFTKLLWSINGQDTNSLRFATSTITDYVASAEMSVTDTTGILDITLSTKGRTALEGLTGFGGSNDTLDVEAGFLLDAAGNASASTRTDVTIAMADTEAPEVTDITAALADSESYGIGDKINFTVTLDKAVKAGSEISLNIKTGIGSDDNNTTLAEFVSVTTNTESTILTGVYDIQANDDSAGLEVLSYSVEEGSVDPYGNAVAEDTPVESIDTILPFSVDATSPTAAPARIWNNTADELKIVFNEELTEASEADIQAAILDVLTDSTAQDVTWNNNKDGDSLFTVTLNGETLSGTVNEDGQEVKTVVFELGLMLEDLAGNTTEIDSLEFTIL
jgi:plastocyanin